MESHTLTSGIPLVFASPKRTGLDPGLYQVTHPQFPPKYLRILPTRVNEITRPCAPKNTASIAVPPPVVSSRNVAVLQPGPAKHSYGGDRQRSLPTNLLPAFRKLSKEDKDRIYEQVKEMRYKPETVARETGVDVNVVKYVIAERDPPNFTTPSHGHPVILLNKSQSASPSPSEAANPNRLLQEIHEQIQSESADAREAKSSAASSSKPFINVRPLPIAALMEDVNPIAVSETEPQEGDDEDRGELIPPN